MKIRVDANPGLQPRNSSPRKNWMTEGIGLVYNLHESQGDFKFPEAILNQDQDLSNAGWDYSKWKKMLPLRDEISNISAGNSFNAGSGEQQSLNMQAEAQTAAQGESQRIQLQQTLMTEHIKLVQQRQEQQAMQAQAAAVEKNTEQGLLTPQRQEELLRLLRNFSGLQENSSQS